MLDIWSAQVDLRLLGRYIHALIVFRNVLYREVLTLGKFSALVLLERINWHYCSVENLLSDLEGMSGSIHTSTIYFCLLFRSRDVFV